MLATARRPRWLSTESLGSLRARGSEWWSARCLAARGRDRRERTTSNLGNTTIRRQNPSLDVLTMKTLGSTTELAPGAGFVVLSRICAANPDPKPPSAPRHRATARFARDRLRMVHTPIARRKASPGASCMRSVRNTPPLAIGAGTGAPCTTLVPESGTGAAIIPPSVPTPSRPPATGARTHPDARWKWPGPPRLQLRPAATIAQERQRLLRGPFGPVLEPHRAGVPALLEAVEHRQQIELAGPRWAAAGPV